MSPLHRRTSDAARIDDVYASSNLCVSAPTSRFPAGEIDRRHAHAMVHDDLMLEGNPRLNLATFCTTWLEPEARALMDDAVTRNIVDKDEYPQTAEIEARCVRMLADQERAAQREPDGDVDDRLERGRDAGRARRQRAGRRARRQLDSTPPAIHVMTAPAANRSTSHIVARPATSGA
jgi:glutamate decarboxylase